MSCFFQRALPKETSLNSANYLTSSYLFVTILVLYFNDYDIHVNTLFKALKDGFTVKVKDVYIQVQNAVDVKRIVTRLAFFQLSEGRSRSSNGSHKQLTTVEAG